MRSQSRTWCQKQIKQNTHGNNRNPDKDLWICTSERTQRITASHRCCSYIWRTHRLRLAAESALAALIPLCWCWHRAVIPSQESPIFELFTPTPLHGLMGSLTARQEKYRNETVGVTLKKEPVSAFIGLDSTEKWQNWTTSTVKVLYRCLNTHLCWCFNDSKYFEKGAKGGKETTKRGPLLAEPQGWKHKI